MWSLYGSLAGACCISTAGKFLLNLMYVLRIQNTYYPSSKYREIIHTALNAPGSWHDCNIKKCIYNKILYDTILGYQVISNTAFQRCTNQLDY
ncbi:hypothetical protein VP01_7020g1 [Puccinia sorghi]|uniref:Uncharacterized protein n=1 Tax=Puccinia sorghi TaxID=27349 RepID=A0A0L6UDQ4_9BASI|nr:hypothetical protein VP01_7020g1 [Puccinia sorghi]